MKKDFRLYIRLSEKDLDTAKKKAIKKKLTVSEFVRKLILGEK